MSSSLFLSPEQNAVISTIEQGRNVFVTGSAGTGKSYLLRYLKGQYINHGLHLTASTGIAAVNIGGVTLHSWAGIGLGVTPVQELAQQLFTPRFARLRKKLRSARMLAIDEISMLAADTFDLINELLKIIRDDERPFGGIQLIVFGDFLQLPPVNKLNEKVFCFESEAWAEANFKVFLLQKVFRQDDALFVQLLDHMRFGCLTQNDMQLLQSRFEAQDTDKLFRPTIISTHTHKAEEVNRDYMLNLQTPEKCYKAYFIGNETKFDFLKKNCLAPEMLVLKQGAQVMMLKNTYQKDGIINGSIGIIRDFSEKKSYPIVEFSNGKTITVGFEEWNIEKFDEQKREIVVEATMVQIPLLPSWAITVHKSQGMTIDKIECDLCDAFAEGQVYVAISRVRTLNGLFIKSFNANRIIVNPKVVQYYQRLLPQLRPVVTSKANRVGSMSARDKELLQDNLPEFPENKIPKKTPKAKTMTMVDNSRHLSAEERQHMSKEEIADYW